MTDPGQSDIVAVRDRLAAAEQALSIARRALEFYAREENWRNDDWGCKAVIVTPDYGDGGKKARNALRRIGKVSG
jgi:hypothetical protein